MSTPTDLELLRRYEPVIRFTHGEFFFPMATDPYIASCDLWAADANGTRTLVVPAGELALEDLAGWRRRVPDRALYLRFVQRPLSGVEMAQGRDRAARPKFHAPSRLARVGILARLVDAGFDLSLLVRGTVPGGTVAASEVKYAEIRERDPRFIYHGRVVRHAGWTVCHYLFFYAMNDWRSSFSGANDHEADWEQCFVFVEEQPDGSTVPVWLARAAHDEVGADLRRRWDDPLVQRVGDHPVIFAGAGSHAAYIEPGEYLLPVPLALPGRLRSAVKAVRSFWTTTLGQGQPSGKASQIGAIPFVDYARGDGVAIGPGQPNEWSPVLIDDDTPWVATYDGLFGLDTNDRMAGERAPAGPKFARDGRPRQSWIDPIAFAGLETTPPPGRAVETLEREIADLREEIVADSRAIERQDAHTQRLGTRVTAAQRAGRSAAYVAGLVEERDTAVHELRALRAGVDAAQAAIKDCEAELSLLRSGDPGDPRAHLRHVVHPQDPSEIRRGRLLDLWSAVSVALALAIFGALVFLEPGGWWIGLLLIIVAYVAIESLVRRRFLELLLQVTILLAILGALILLWTYFPWAIAIGLLAIGILILRDNVRELRWSRG